jgi:hypothetical protein
MLVREGIVFILFEYPGEARPSLGKIKWRKKKPAQSNKMLTIGNNL